MNTKAMEGQSFRMSDEHVEMLSELAKIMTNGNNSEALRQLIVDKWNDIVGRR